MPKIVEVIKKFNLDEPSTYVAAGAAVSVFGIPIDLFDASSNIIAGICFIIGWLKSEKK